MYNGTTWTAFANLVTTAVTPAPSCTTDNNGGVVCSIFTIKGATLVDRFVAATSKWEGFLNIGGIAGGEPDLRLLELGRQRGLLRGSLYLRGSMEAGSTAKPGALPTGRSTEVSAVVLTTTPAVPATSLTNWSAV